MPVASQFFHKIPDKIRGMVASGSAEKSVFIEMGSQDDTCFPAFAVGIINNILTRPKTNQALAVTLLTRFTDHFALPQMTGQMLTPFQRFEKMLARPQILAQFIQDVSYTLRVIGVDELCKNPEKYDGFFNGREGWQSLLMMRELGSPLSEQVSKYAMAALANALKIPVVIYVTETGKELPLQENYGPDRKHARFDGIVLLSQRNHYLVHITEVKRFRAASQQASHLSIPLQRNSGADVDMSIIHQRIKAENRRLLETFEQNAHRLTAMIEAGELNKEDLLALYIKTTDILDEKYLLYRAKKTGTAHGSQNFFNDLFDKSTSKRPIPGFVANESHDERVVKELVCAFARDISLGRLDEYAVFTHLDQLEQQRRLR